MNIRLHGSLKGFTKLVKFGKTHYSNYIQKPIDFNVDVMLFIEYLNIIIRLLVNKDVFVIIESKKYESDSVVYEQTLHKIQKGKISLLCKSFGLITF